MSYIAAAILHIEPTILHLPVNTKKLESAGDITALP